MRESAIVDDEWSSLTLINQTGMLGFDKCIRRFPIPTIIFNIWNSLIFDNFKCCIHYKWQAPLEKCSCHWDQYCIIFTKRGSVHIFEILQVLNKVLKFLEILDKTTAASTENDVERKPLPRSLLSLLWYLIFDEIIQYLMILCVRYLMISGS